MTLRFLPLHPDYRDHTCRNAGSSFTYSYPPVPTFFLLPLRSACRAVPLPPCLPATGLFDSCSYLPAPLPHAVTRTGWVYVYSCLRCQPVTVTPPACARLLRYRWVIRMDTGCALVICCLSRAHAHRTLRGTRAYTRLPHYRRTTALHLAHRVPRCRYRDYRLLVTVRCLPSCR